MKRLDVLEVSVHYGQVKAVEGVSVALEAGKIVGVIGPNGAGKSSLIDALSGFAPLAGGSVELNGLDISAMAPHVRSRLGLGRTWQSGELFEDLTARENLLAVADAPRWWTMLADVMHPGRRVTHDGAVGELMAAFELDDVADRLVSAIPQDKRKLVTIARALANDPAVVLMDEPAAGLNTEETAALGRQLRRLAAGGLAILLIEHDIELVATVCDRIVVLDFGKTIADGPPQQILNDQRVIAAYLGETSGLATASSRVEARS
jgi:ABC-type branched-subunit amino acid transport system ATPase component